MSQIDGAEKISVAKTDTFRSQNSGVNQDYDMVRVTLDMPIWVWRTLRKLIGK